MTHEEKAARLAGAKEVWISAQSAQSAADIAESDAGPADGPQSIKMQTIKVILQSLPRDFEYARSPQRSFGSSGLQNP